MGPEDKYQDNPYQIQVQIKGKMVWFCAVGQAVMPDETDDQHQVQQHKVAGEGQEGNIARISVRHAVLLIGGDITIFSGMMISGSPFFLFQSTIDLWESDWFPE